ncbi:3137_t:CDS:10 [Funneliformis geosporum]|uniref:3137_t:CDS:1 n=1 Tax=Funneliformis geosporum TaxID=1117311 RepID=A0A9W4SHD7_9GLOM|nr:3137_t:CDS:10 [Funneliformis geosporum]
MATFATDKEINASFQSDVHLGVSSFSAVAGLEDRDVLATATTEIFGRFQALKTLLHPNICEYVEIVKGKHDRLFVIFEYHMNHLGKLYQGEGGNMQITRIGISMLREWAFQILKALTYLNQNGITHHNLDPHNILLDAEGKVKLADYGLFYMTNGGADVDFPIGYPHYLPAEAIYRQADMPEVTGKVDVWSLGVILAEIFTGSTFWKENDKDIEKLFFSLWMLQSFVQEEGETDDDAGVWNKLIVHQLGINDPILDFLQDSADDDLADLDFRNFIRACLKVDVSNRCSPEQLLSHPFFSGHGLSDNYKYWWKKPFLQSQSIDFDEENMFIPIDEQPNKDVLYGIPLSQIYYFWKLAGGDVETELAKRGFLLSTPPIERIPRTVKVQDGKEEGTTKDTAFLFSDTIYTLSLKELRQRLEVATGPNRETFEWDTDYFMLVDEDDMNFLVDEMSDDDNSSTKDDDILGKYLYPDPNNHKASLSSTNGQTTPPTNNIKLPLLIREKDVGYQFQRVALFSELLRQYPASRDEIIHHAKVDIPPFLRGRIWAAILGIYGDYQALYDSYDKETEKETATDRQIDVDVPRCHQYNQLLSSPIGHEKLRRLLKCFIVANANNKLVYWQGLDSLCAPFLTLNFNDEALAFSCLHTFIPKFLQDVFLFDNSSVIAEYLAVFKHLLSFHDPELSSHLNKIGYQPDLYAIPWFLTLFTHVFPLDKTYHLWDKILVGPPSLPLFTGISILRQLRDLLLQSEFNECLAFAESFPDVDIEKCIQSALSMCKVTPPSVIYRVHEPFVTPGASHNGIQGPKEELTPRISLKDLVKLKNHVLVIDTRSELEFSKGHFPLSVNMNPVHLEQLAQTLRQENKKYHVVLAKKGDGPQFAAELVYANFSRVAVLTGSIDVMRVDTIDTKESVPVCTCRSSKIFGSKNGGAIYWKCTQNLMKQTQ